jgi:hypothetical protein
VDLGLDTLNIFLLFLLGRKSRQNEKRKNTLFREREREKEKGLVKEGREHVLVFFFCFFFFFSERFPSRSRALESSKTTRP